MRFEAHQQRRCLAARGDAIEQLQTQAALATTGRSQYERDARRGFLLDRVVHGFELGQLGVPPHRRRGTTQQQPALLSQPLPADARHVVLDKQLEAVAQQRCALPVNPQARAMARQRGGAIELAGDRGAARRGPSGRDRDARIGAGLDHCQPEPHRTQDQGVGQRRSVNRSRMVPS